MCIRDSLVSDRGGDEGHLGLALFLMGASELPAALLFTPLFRRFGAAGRFNQVWMVFSFL